MTDGGSDTFEALAAAISADDAARASDVLGRHPELASRLNDPLPGGHFGATALLAALPRGNRELIDALLRAGADINARSHWWAGGFGVLDHDYGLDAFLIERGAVVDAHAAARLGMLGRLAALVDADPALVHARGGDGQTPLHVAGSVEAARFLVEHGAEIDARDIDHESTPAQYMLRDRHDVARFLVARGAATDILMAAALGDLACAREHLERDPECVRTRVCGRDFPRRDPRAGGTIYFWTLGWHKGAHAVARAFGHREVFELLMEHSPDALKLSAACEVGERALVQTVLASHPGLSGPTPEEERRKIADAAQSNNEPAVRLMLDAGWPVDARGDEGGTPLHFAAWIGNADLVREILGHRPPVDARCDTYDRTPLDWALHGSRHSWRREAGDYAGVVDALLDAGADAPTFVNPLEASTAALAVLQRRGKLRPGPA